MGTSYIERGPKNAVLYQNLGWEGGENALAM